MILTCPSCGTRYVVKDGAIPPAGRTVRCAQCKHSWHQDPEEHGEAEQGGLGEADAEQTSPSDELSSSDAGRPLGEGQGPVSEDEPDDSVHPVDTGEFGTADDPLPTAEAAPTAAMLAEQETENSMPPEAAAAPEPYPEEAVPPEAGGPYPDQFVSEPVAEAETPRSSHPLRAARVETEDLYSPFAGDEEDAPQRNRLPMIIGGILLLIALVAAGVYFLAPAELKSRLGLAQGDSAEDLTVQVEQSGRTKLASGNQLFEVRGIVRNETDKTMAVPPLNAQLRSAEQRVVYRWTIPIYPPQLEPGASATFNSANLDVPAAAACLEVFFGQERRVDRCVPEQQAGA